MRRFTDETGREWIAEPREEATPRHHGRWYLLMRPADGSGLEMAALEVRWQTRETGERTIATMSEFELRRRLVGLRGRFELDTERSREAGANAGSRAAGPRNAGRPPAR